MQIINRSPAFKKIYILTLRLPWDEKTLRGYCYMGPVFAGLFVLIFYSVICVLGLMLAMFVMMLSITDYVSLRFHIAQENFANNRSKETFLHDFLDTTRFAVKSME